LSIKLKKQDKLSAMIKESLRRSTEKSSKFVYQMISFTRSSRSDLQRMIAVIGDTFLMGSPRRTSKHKRSSYTSPRNWMRMVKRPIKKSLSLKRAKRKVGMAM
jgi:hypothetical protein